MVTVDKAAWNRGNKSRPLYTLDAVRADCAVQVQDEKIQQIQTAANCRKLRINVRRGGGGGGGLGC